MCSRPLAQCGVPVMPSPFQIRWMIRTIGLVTCLVSVREDRACGWETAVAYEVLRNKVKERKVDMAAL